MKMYIVAGLLLSLAVALPIQAATTTYVTRPSWESAVGGIYDEEQFADAVLNPGLSVVSSVGVVDTGAGNWSDRLTPSDTTTWTFANPINAYGGNWDLTPGGPGYGITLLLDGVPVSPEIANNFAGGFFGITSTVNFNQVKFAIGTAPNSSAETFRLDNMVYSANTIPEPSTLGLIGLGLAVSTVFGLRRRNLAV